MINLKHHLSNYVSSPDVLLKEKSESVWGFLNKEIDKITGKKPGGKSITDKAKSFLSEVQGTVHRAKYGTAAAQRHQTVMSYILQADVLKQLITSEPKQLANYASILDAKLLKDDFEKINGNISFSELLLTKVFNYKTYRDSIFCAELYISLHFSKVTCPYCNEYSVKVVEFINKKDQKPLLHFDLDHFYLKHRYPYLALSFYNHIPSCKYCNSLHKREKIFTIDSHIHPYRDNFDAFYYFYYSHRALMGEKIDDVKIRKNKAPFVDKLCEELELEDRYRENLEYARINHLIDILADNADLLYDPNRNSGADLERLKMRLHDFGLTTEARKILQKPWSKMQRDLVKIFDINNVLIKN